MHSAQQHGSSFRVFWRSQPRQGASKFALKKRDQSRAPLTKWGFNLSARNMDLSQAKAAFSHRSSCHSSKRSKQINQTTQEALCYVKKGRENTARDCALARHQRPWALAQRKARGATTTTPAHHSHAATAPCPRPQSRHQGTAPRHHVQSRVQKQKARSRAEHWSYPRAPQAEDKPRGKKEAKERAEQRATKGSSLPLQKSATPTALTAAVVQLCAMIGWLTSFCRTTAQRKKGSEVAVALRANSAVRHLRRVRHVKTGPLETRRRGTSTTHITHQHQHTRWTNSEDSRNAPTLASGL